MNPLNPFLKRLGSLTATLSPRTKAFRRASHILSYEAVQRRKAQDLIAEDERRAKFEDFFRRRKEVGGSGHYRWWENITRFVNSLEDDVVSQ